LPHAREAVAQRALTCARGLAAISNARHKRLYSVKREIDGDPIPLGPARIACLGTEITIVAAMTGVQATLDAGELLATDGIGRGHRPPHPPRPLDTDTVPKSLAKTNNLLISKRGPESAGGPLPSSPS